MQIINTETKCEGRLHTKHSSERPPYGYPHRSHHKNTPHQAKRIIYSIPLRFGVSIALCSSPTFLIVTSTSRQYLSLSTNRLTSLASDSGRPAHPFSEWVMISFSVAFVMLWFLSRCVTIKPWDERMTLEWS